MALLSTPSNRLKLASLEEAAPIRLATFVRAALKAIEYPFVLSLSHTLLAYWRKL
jgi:hypothetical protein